MPTMKPSLNRLDCGLPAAAEDASGLGWRKMANDEAMSKTLNA
jgi:hypothetical protein